MGKEITVVDGYYCFCNTVLSFRKYVSVDNIASVVIIKNTTKF